MSTWPVKAVYHRDGGVTVTLNEADKAALWIAVREGRIALAREYAAHDSTFELDFMRALSRKGFGAAQSVVSAHTERKPK